MPWQQWSGKETDQFRYSALSFAIVGLARVTNRRMAKIGRDHRNEKGKEMTRIGNDARKRTKGDPNRNPSIGIGIVGIGKKERKVIALAEMRIPFLPPPRVPLRTKIGGMGTAHITEGNIVPDQKKDMNEENTAAAVIVGRGQGLRNEVVGIEAVIAVHPRVIVAIVKIAERITNPDTSMNTSHVGDIMKRGYE